VVIGGQLDPYGQEWLQVVDGGHVHVGVLQGLAGQGVEGEYLRALQRPARDERLDAGAGPHGEDRPGHLDDQDRRFGIGVERKGMRGDREQARR